MIVRGKLSQAAEFYNRAIQLSIGRNGQPYPAASEAYARLASLYCEWNDLDLVMANTQQSLALSQVGEPPSDVILSKTDLAEVFMAQREFHKARTLTYEVLLRIPGQTGFRILSFTHTPPASRFPPIGKAVPADSAPC